MQCRALEGSIPRAGRWMVVASFPGFGFNFIFVFSMARRARINAFCILILGGKSRPEDGCWITFLAFIRILVPYSMPEYEIDNIRQDRSKKH